MKMKHLLLPLMAGMACYVTTATARMAPEMQTMQKSSSLHFVENKGQITDQYLAYRKDIDFKLNGGNGLSIFIGNGKMHYQWSKPSASTTSRASRASAIEGLEGSDESAVIEALDNAVAEVLEAYRMDVELIGANPYARIITEGKQSFYERYFLSWVNTNNSNEGVIAHAFSKITYKDIYPNIDWVFYFNGKGQLEHDFVVHPGGKVSDIRIKYSGADALEINPDGSLRATTPMGMVTENAPYAYTVHRAIQEGEEISPLRSASLHFGRDDGRIGVVEVPVASAAEASAAEVLEALEATEATEVVASKFRLDDNILSFEVAPYSGTLIIDPVIEWGTYFGGSGDETVNGITMDPFNNIYFCGSTSSTANIATTGAHQVTFAGGKEDAFISKWNKDGDLLWASYYGGSNVDIARGIACDSLGNVYIGGNTRSTDGISTPSSFQTKLNEGGGDDVFLIKFDSSGQRKWGTYYGGTNYESNTSFGLTIDKFNRLYITGNTQSSDLPTTSGAHQTSHGGNQDVFVARFDSGGDLIWSTYYGGSAADYGYAIATDSIGNVYVTGRTESISNIATAAAYQSINGGKRDAFISKFDSAGKIIWATYLGGGANEIGYTITSKNGIVVVGGYSTSESGVSTPNVHQTTKGANSNDDGLLAVFDLDGQVKWVTYYGGEKVDFVNGVYIDREGFIYISGESESEDNIASAGSFQDALNSSSRDVFFAKFNNAGERLWGSYYGGIGIESSGYIAGDDNKNIYLSGKSNSATGIATTNAHQASVGGGFDAFLVRFNDCEKPEQPTTIAGDTKICVGTDQVYAVDKAEGITYVWTLPGEWEGAGDSNTIIVTVGKGSGVVKVVAVSDCGGISDTQSLEVTVLPLPEPEIINNNNILSTDQSYASYQWIWDGEDIEDATSATHIATKDGDYTVRVTNEDGCEGLSEVEAVTGTVTIQHPDRNSAIEVYPNPAKNMVYVQSDISGFMYLYGMDGRLLNQDIPLSVGINSLKIDDLGMGIYQLQIATDKGLSVFKIVKTE